MQKQLSKSEKIPAFLKMLNDDKKRIKEMEQILKAPSHLLSEEEKADKAESLLLKYEHEAEQLSKWNNFVQVDCTSFPEITIKISEKAPNPHRTLVIFNLLISSVNRNGSCSYTAQSLAEKIECHINNVYPSLKWLRENDMIQKRDIDNKYYVKSDNSTIYISDWLVRKRRSFKEDQRQKILGLTKSLNKNKSHQLGFHTKFN